MDFLKNHNTTVHLLQGFSVIHYRVYELFASRDEAEDVRAQPLNNEYTRVKAMKDVEWRLRNHGLLVAVGGQIHLWLFDSSEEQMLRKLSLCGADGGIDAALAVDGRLKFVGECSQYLARECHQQLS